MLEKYFTKNGKILRCGFTTGTCTTAASKACAIMLLSGKKINSVCLTTPNNVDLTIEIHDVQLEENSVTCAVKKDSGDDPDITNGMMIYVKLTKCGEKIIEIDGGIGIGKVTKAGLDQAVGNAAINSVPRMTIKQALNEVCEDFAYEKGFKVLIFAPQGEELAKKTYNSRLGIVGGLSILGTTGIVEPMSEDAIIETIKAEINVKFEEGKRQLILTPGNYGKKFIDSKMKSEDVVKCSNYIGNAIDYAYQKGFKSILIIGHAGKLLKLACGMFNTHSKFGDCRAEVIATYSALYGAKSESVAKILSCVTADEMILECKKTGVYEKVMAKIMEKISFNLDARVYSEIEISAIVFTDKWGIIGSTLKKKEYYLGIGCRKDIEKEKIEDLFFKVLNENNIDIKAIKLVASIDLKENEQGLLEFCEKFNFPVNFYSADELMQLKGEFTASNFVKSITGVENVCERSALKASENGKIIVKKTSQNGVTIAVASREQEVYFE